jgi:putative transposase
MKLNGVSHKQVYAALGISKQAVHTHIQRESRYLDVMSQLEILLNQIRYDHPVMGLRKIHDMLKGCGIGRDRFESHFFALGFGVEQKKNYRRTTDSRGVTRFDNLIKDLQLFKPDQVWASDITYFAIGNRFYYLTFIIDLYTHRIVGYSVSSNLQTVCTTMPALQMAIRCRGYSKKNKPVGLIFHSDGGGQYYCKEFVEILRELDIASSMAEDVWENSTAERLNGIIKNEYLIHRQIKSVRDLIKEVDRTIRLYNHKRGHSSIKNHTPIEFEEKLLSLQRNKEPMVKKLIDGNSGRKGHRAPFLPGNKKPQARNLSLEIQPAGI